MIGWLRSLLVDVIAEAVAEGVAKGVDLAKARARPPRPPAPAHDGILAGFAAEVERRRREAGEAVYDEAETELRWRLESTPHDPGPGR